MTLYFEMVSVRSLLSAWIALPRISAFLVSHPGNLIRLRSSILYLNANDSEKYTASFNRSDLDQVDFNLDSLPEQFQSIVAKTIQTTIPKEQDNSKNAHDPFRFEWGTWVNTDRLQDLMISIDSIRASPGSFELLLAEQRENTPTNDAVKVNLLKGQQWEMNLYAFSSNSQYQKRHPTGSWTILKALTGVVEIAMMREDRNGNYKKSTKKDLRGGFDPFYQLGKSNTPNALDSMAIGGEECIKYVGGPLRSYMGKSQRNILLELVIRPPGNEISFDTSDDNTWDINCLEKIVDVYIPPVVSESDGPNEKEEDGENMTSVTAQQLSTNLGSKLGMEFNKVGGLDAQLDTIVRRVLASRANPQTAKRLGISHVRGVLFYGPPGCGKTLLARELARLLGAREPQIVNGPEILDKFIGEAEKRVRDLFKPAEMEYAAVGDNSALHVIILDEMDAIARKRGSASSDTTGVRDSVVNQLLAKIDGVKEANNILVIGLTNRPELLDPALLRPGRLEVQLRVELPDLSGRRDIFRIHTRQMKEAGGLHTCAQQFVDDLSENGLASKTDKFTGAEIAGLVRSAASFALARSVSATGLERSHDDENTLHSSEDSELKVTREDFEEALLEVVPVLGKQDALLQMRFPNGISAFSPSMERIMRDLKRFIAPNIGSSKVHSLLLVGEGSRGGAGVTALGAWTAAEASKRDSLDYVRIITALDLLSSGDGSGSEGARASALIDCFSEAREMPNSMLVLDDIDQLCAGTGPAGYSSVMISTLRALLRIPPEISSFSKTGKQSKTTTNRSMSIIGTTSRSDAACIVLHELFEESIMVPLLSDIESVENLLLDLGYNHNARVMATLMIEKMGRLGVKTVVRLAERACASAIVEDCELNTDPVILSSLQISALEVLLSDLEFEMMTSTDRCKVY